jgi:hypothetical protein
MYIKAKVNSKPYTSEQKFYNRKEIIYYNEPKHMIMNGKIHKHNNINMSQEKRKEI